MIIEILEEAENDILAVHKWYESKRSGLGADFELCIEEISVISKEDLIKNKKAAGRHKDLDDAEVLENT